MMGHLRERAAVRAIRCDFSLTSVSGWGIQSLQSMLDNASAIAFIELREWDDIS
jgi:hypothetical protein